ncbi:MAG: fibronectin type III domain-containing protein [Candidatus Thermoplasmatota archaeon]|nr:fibronectin type III domain-containing protein [Candidatus Thermoplasmatota archaeon]
MIYEKFQVSFAFIILVLSSFLFDSTPQVDGEEFIISYDSLDEHASTSLAAKISGSVFTRNNGQIKDEGILFYGSGPDGRIAFSKDGIYFTSVKRGPEVEEPPYLDPGQIIRGDRIPSTDGAMVSINTIKLSFPGRNDVIPTGRDPAPWFSNFFYGNDPEKWRTQVPNYREIVYKDLWDGIDLVYRTDSGSVKYDIIIHPRSDPTRIGFRLEGHNGLEVNERGDLVIATDHRDLLDTGLVAFYEDGPDESIPCDFMITGHDTYGFEIGSYDLSRVLIVDPLIYSTFIGVFDSCALGIALDSNENAYITGYTERPDFPTTIGAFDVEYNGVRDVFVTKLDNTGSSLLYSTFIGGTMLEYAYEITLDSNGNTFITGVTNSTDYPTTVGAYDRTHNGDYDVFVTKLDNTGSSLLYSAFIGGSGREFGHAMALDSNGNTFITGVTFSTDYPTTVGAYDRTHNGKGDVFITKLDTTGSSLVYSTFIGGSDDESGNGIALDTIGNAYIIGSTGSQDYPTSIVAYDKTHNGKRDVFVTKLDNTGSSLLYSTFIGGSDDEGGAGIVVDSNGNAYIIGGTDSTNYPTSSGAYDKTHNGFGDAFVSKLNSAGSSLLYSTFIGGGYNDWGSDIVIDPDGNALITGGTWSPNFPTTESAFDNTYNSLEYGYDIFVTRLNSTGSSLDYSTFIGGSYYDTVFEAALNKNMTVYITGDTSSHDYPTTSGAYDVTHDGGYDVFVTALDLTRSPEAPLGIRAAAGDAFIDLAWDPPLDDGGARIVDYEVHRGSKSGSLSKIASTGGNTTYNDTDVVNGNRYYYAVLAVNRMGAGKPSGEVSSIPGKAPDPPGSFVAIYGNGMVNLTWNSPSSNGGYVLQGYRIYKFTGEIQEREMFQTGPNMLSFSDENVVNGINYRYYITAFNAMGESIPSIEVNATPRTSPLPVQNVQVRSGPQHVLLSWDLPGSDGGRPIINFNVFRAVHSGNFVRLVTLASSVMSYNDTEVENGVLYRYRVYAVNSEGSSNPSEEISAMPLDRPSPPRNLVSESESNTVLLSWNVPLRTGGSQILGYRIYRKESNLIWEMISEPKAADDSYTDRTVLNGRSYLYRITAFNIVGESDPTGSVEAAPIGPPGIPMRFDLVTGDHFVHLIWDIPLNDGGAPIIGFKVYRGETNGLINLYRSVTSSDLSYNDTNVVNGITYHYRVTAVNNIGEGAATETKNTKPAGIPSPPSNINVVSGDGFIDISWAEPEDDGGDPVTDVKIYRGEDPNSSVVILTTSILGGSFRDTTVTNGVTYHYTLTSTNSIGESVHSPPIFATPSGKPSVPLNVEIEAASKAISLSWGPPEDTGGITLTGYRIYRSSGTGNPVLIAELGPESNEYMDRDVERENLYRYQVSAVNDNGEGPLSNPVEGKVKEGSGIVLVIAISIIIILILLLGIAAAVMMMRRRGSPQQTPDSPSPPIPSTIREPTHGEGEIPPSQGGH